MATITPEQQEWVRKTCKDIQLRAKGAWSAGFWYYNEVIKEAKPLERSQAETFHALMRVADRILERQRVYQEIPSITKLAMFPRQEDFNLETLAQAKREAIAVLEAQFGPRTPEMGLPPELANWPEPQESIYGKSVLAEVYSSWKSSQGAIHAIGTMSGYQQLKPKEA